VDFIEASFGLLLLFLAGDLLVRGAVSAGLRLQIPAIVIGLTIVAFGTSAPELFVTVTSSIAGSPGIAVGNVVGSNIANVLLVIGLPAILRSLGDNSQETKRNFIIMIGATIVAMLLMVQGQTRWIDGVILLSLLGVFLFDAYRTSMISRREAIAKGRDVDPDHDFEEINDADPEMPVWKIVGLIAAGLIGLPCGADLTVTAASRIAEQAGFSKEVIGLTLVAIGTSLPELATTVMAAVRGRADVAVGNVIGSNIFNLLCILGVAAVLDPLIINSEFLWLNLPIMAFAAIILAPYIWLDRSVGRISGVFFTAAYVIYLILVLKPTAA
jgi:cation:H+ antiporter